jgi:hypothetical protein
VGEITKGNEGSEEEQDAAIMGKTVVRRARGRQLLERPEGDGLNGACQPGRVKKGSALGRVSALSYNCEMPPRKMLVVDSDSGGEYTPILYTIIETAKLNGLDPEAYLITRIADHPARRIDKLLPWNITL